MITDMSLTPEKLKKLSDEEILAEWHITMVLLYNLLDKRKKLKGSKDLEPLVNMSVKLHSQRSMILDEIGKRDIRIETVLPEEASQKTRLEPFSLN